MSEDEKTVQQQLSDELDRQMLNRIKYGVPIQDSDGSYLRDAEGNLQYRPATGTELQAARQRLKDLGLNKVVHEDNPDDPAHELAERAAEADGEAVELPNLDVEDDDGATE